MTATIATDKGCQKVAGSERPLNVYALTKGKAYRLCEDGWALVDYSGPNKVECAYTHTIKWVSGQACAIFDWGGVQYAQPINGNVTPGKKPKKAKPEPLPEIVVHTPAPKAKPVKAKPATKAPPPEKAKLDDLLAAFKSRRK